MQNIRYVYWQDGGFWLGHLAEHPDYLTQGTSLDDLKEHLLDLYGDLSGGGIPGVRKPAERRKLKIGGARLCRAETRFPGNKLRLDRVSPYRHLP
jgi:hypothetical protein